MPAGHHGMVRSHPPGPGRGRTERKVIDRGGRRKGWPKQRYETACNVETTNPSFQ